MFRRSPAVAAAAVALGCSLASIRAYAALPQVDLSGFGTAGFAISDEGHAEFARAQQQMSGVNNQGDVGIDSLFGVQGNVHLSDTFSATTQAIVRRLFNAGFQLDIPVFFVKADVTRDLSFRAGRFQLPVFMSSDYRQVGYSNTWVRPPIEMYGQVPFDSEDGVDALYRTTLGSADISAQAFYGKSDQTFQGVSVQTRKSWGVNVNATVGPLSVRVSRNQSLFSSDSAQVTQLLAKLRAVGFVTLANQLNPVNVPFQFTTYGFSLDEPEYTVQGEISKQSAGGFLASAHAEYLLAGYRIRKFTPYGMYARQKITSKRTDTTIPRFGPFLPLAQAVNQLINSTGADQHTITGGVRWDVHESVDVKAQIDRVTPEGNGLFINVQPGFHGPVWVASMTLDFVF